LAQALLFSLLYGAEFLERMDVVQRCEAAWWTGVRKFYGLPNGVSNVTLHLLFPRFSLVHRVLMGKVALLLRGMRRTDTLFPEALIFDRGYLFERHRTGFNQSIKDWGTQLGIDDLFLVTDRVVASEKLQAVREKTLDSAWETFSRMPSTCLVASMLGVREGLSRAAGEASKVSRLGLRVFLLAATGSLAQSYIHTRSCPPCGVRFDFAHFLSCPLLGDDLHPRLVDCGAREEWKEFVTLILGRFHTFIHFFRDGQCDSDEVELFTALNEPGGEDEAGK
jgi:hypothetical protein